MKSFKRMLSFILVTIILVSMIANTGVSISASTGICGDNITWAIDDGVLTVSGSGGMYDYGDPDLGEEPAPWGNSWADIDCVVVGDDITYIGAYAFSGLYNVKSITIGNAVEIIGTAAFAADTSLTDIYIPGNVKNIGDYAFNGCYSLSTVFFSSGLQSIGACAFQSCNSLTAVDLPEGVMKIGSRAFSNCIDLASAKLPDSINNMGTAIFHKESYYSSVEVICSIGSYAADHVASNPQCGNLKILGVTDFGACGNTLDWYLDDNGVLAVYGTGDMYDYDDVESDASNLAPWCYDHNEDIRKVVVGNYVTSVGRAAFCDLTRLESVSIGNSVESIGVAAFANTALKSVAIPSSVVSIGDASFGSCYSLEVVTLSQGLETIGNHVFREAALVEVIIPEGVTSIGNYAFAFCHDLERITIPDTVNSIGLQAFYVSDYSRLDVTIVCSIESYADSYADSRGYEVEYIGYLASGICGINVNWYLVENGTLYIVGDGAMYSYTDVESNPANAAPWLGQYVQDIKSVVIRKGVTSVSQNAFSHLPGLESVIIGSSVTTINSNAFYGCYSLRSVTMTRKVKAINSYAFSGCISLRDIDLLSGLESIGSYAFAYCESLEKIMIPDSVTSIGIYAFTLCPGIRNVEIGDGLTSVNAGVFEGCSGLEDLTLGSSIITISDYAFSYCTSLTDVTLPNSVTTIKPYAFAHCAKYGSYRLSKYVKSIAVNSFSAESIFFCPAGSYAAKFALKYGMEVVYSGTVFEGICGDDLSWVLDPNTGELDITGTGAIPMFASKTEAPWYKYKNIITAVVIGDEVSSVGNYAFYEYENIESVTLGNNVVSVGNYVFYDCVSLSEINIKGSLSSLGRYSFYRCESLESIELCEGLTVIPDYAFYACKSLESIALPDSVTEIKTNAFAYCTTLTAINISSGVLSIGENALYNCTSLESINVSENNPGYMSVDGVLFNKSGSVMIRYPSGKDLSVYSVPDSVEIISESAFSGASKLVDVDFGAGLKEIGKAAFRDCASLVEICIPDSVTVIGSSVFYECASLERVAIGASVAEIPATAFFCCENLGSILVRYGVKKIAPNAFSGCDNIAMVCCKGSYAEKYAIENDIPYEGYVGIDTENYTLKVYGANDLVYIEYASGVHETLESIKQGENYYGMSAIKIAKYTVDDVFSYEVATGGVYSVWLKYADGTKHIKVVDFDNMTQHITNYGIYLTVHNLYGVRDFFIAKGEYTTYSELKYDYIVRVTENKINGVKTYTYPLKEGGTYTVYIRYTDPDRADYYEYVNINVTTPAYIQNGLQLTVENLEGAKTIRTAYGEHNSVSEVKEADTYRTVSKDMLSGKEDYTIQYRESGRITVAVQYTNGFTDIKHFDLSQKVPVMVQQGNTVTFGNLDGLQVIRYAKGEYETSGEIKRAEGAEFVQSDGINEKGEIEITLDEKGVYTFCVQYNEGSYNYYTVTAE